MGVSPTSFKHGNTARAVPPRIVLGKFKEMIELAKTDSSILCWQDACHAIGWRCSKVEYWVNKNPVFEKLKEDVKSHIVSRVNSKALKGDFSSTPSIWRMKQLGEKEEQTIDHRNNGQSFEPPKITFSE